ECTKALEDNRDAWFFSLRLGKNIVFCGMLNHPQPVPRGKRINSRMFKWKFSSVKVEGDWNYPNTTDTTVYRKNDIRSFLKRALYENPNRLESLWTRIAPKKKKGICFTRSRAINIPMNVVNPYFSSANMEIPVTELLSKFVQGSKIDVDAFYKVNNPSPHVNYNPRFIQR
ncbi:MAG: hypothetical protein JSR46_09795, partial [Verrucomicrobia bacterium]|nr:hypothetical protein [Verrucomicrobiota bacterium]